MVWGDQEAYRKGQIRCIYRFFLPLKMHFLDKNAIIRLLGIEITTNA